MKQASVYRIILLLGEVLKGLKTSNSYHKSDKFCSTGPFEDSGRMEVNSGKLRDNGGSSVGRNCVQI